MSADAMNLETVTPLPEGADFRLSSNEVEKGERAASAYINSVKPGDGRRNAEEALDTLTYDNEVRVVQKGLALVAQDDPSG